MIRGIRIVCLFTIANLFCAGQSTAASSFVKINLKNGVTVELPNNWKAMTGNKRTTLEAWKESLFEERNLNDMENDMPFAANYYDERGDTAGTFAIRYYPTLKIEQSEALVPGEKFISELDAGVRQSFTQGVEAGGGKVVAWLGTSRKYINGTVYFISENRQLSPRGDGFHGILVRYLNAGRSFTIMISYREDQEFYLRPICAKIIGSIHN